MTPEEAARYGEQGRETAVYQESLKFIADLMSKEDRAPADTLARYEIPRDGFIEVLVYLVVAHEALMSEGDEHSALTQVLTVAILLGADLRSKHVI